MDPLVASQLTDQSLPWGLDVSVTPIKFLEHAAASYWLHIHVSLIWKQVTRELYGNGPSRPQVVPG